MRGSQNSVNRTAMGNHAINQDLLHSMAISKDWLFLSTSMSQIGSVPSTTASSYMHMFVA